MKIIITGVAGFIGSNLASKLLSMGFKITGIDNLSYGRIGNLEQIFNHPNFTLILGDLANPRLLKNLQGDAIIHLASSNNPYYTSAFMAWEENHQILNHIIQKSIHDRSRLVFASTTGIYKPIDIIPHKEDSVELLHTETLNPWSLSASKLRSEQIIATAAQESGLEYTIMRLSKTYGPNQNISRWGFTLATYINNILDNKPLEIPGDGSQTSTFNYIDDTLQGIIKCTLSGAAINNVFNIASHPCEEISLKDLALRIWGIINYDDADPDITFTTHHSLASTLEPFRQVADISKIQKMLGYEPSISLTEGLRLTINWQQNLHAKHIVSS